MEGFCINGKILSTKDGLVEDFWIILKIKKGVLRILIRIGINKNDTSKRIILNKIRNNIKSIFLNM